MKLPTPSHRIFKPNRLRRRMAVCAAYFMGIFASMAAGAAVVAETAPWFLAGG